MPRRRALKLVSVHQDKFRARAFLYELLKERGPHDNISHRAMPTWRQHVAYVTASPAHRFWYLVELDGEYVGDAYLTDADEIGVHVRDAATARTAVLALIATHPRKRYLANVNPRNAQLAALFKSLGFALLQHTYEMRAADVLRPHHRVRGGRQLRP